MRWRRHVLSGCGPGDTSEHRTGTYASNYNTLFSGRNKRQLIIIIIIIHAAIDINGNVYT